MTEREMFQKAFAPLHASPHTLTEVRSMANKTKKTHHKVTKGAVIALAAALLLTASFAAGILKLDFARLTPAANVTQAVLSAFGEGSVSIGERVPTDAGNVETLVGEHLYALDASMTVGDYTLTLGSFLIDEQGMGVLTYTLENPHGVVYEDYGGGVGGFPCEPVLFLNKPKGDLVMSACHLDRANSTDTCLQIAVFFGTFTHDEAGAPLFFCVYDGADMQAVCIRPESYAPVTALSGSGSTVSLSPLGISVKFFAEGEAQVNKLTLHYADGSSYVVESDVQNLENRCLGYIIDGESSNFVFNRLVDVNAVTAVTLEGFTCGSDGAQTPLCVTYLP